MGTPPSSGLEQMAGTRSAVPAFQVRHCLGQARPVALRLGQAKTV